MINNEYDPEMEFDIGDLIVCKNGTKHLLIDLLENGENDYDDDQIFKVLNLKTHKIKDYYKITLFEEKFKIEKVLKSNQYKIVEK